MRHGATEKPGVLLGQFDAVLSDEGRRQARETARQLVSERIERIVCSALARARETAQILAEHLGVAMVSDAGLNEISYGCWDGLSWNQIERLYPQIAKQKVDDWWSATPPDGESTADFAQRVEQIWASLLAHPARSTVVVAHEAVNAVLLELARRQGGGDNKRWQPDWRRISSFKQEPGAFCRLTVEVE
jgi:probable phosphoglycerate mutase